MHVKGLSWVSIGATDFGNPFWVRGYKNTLPRRASQANMHGKTRAGVVCFSLERKKDFASPWRLYEEGQKLPKHCVRHIGSNHDISNIIERKQIHTSLKR